MKITLITVGKIKEKYLKDAIAEYSKRLSRYCKLEIIEVADEKTPDTASETVEDGIRDKEGERILKYVKDDAYVVTLEIKGKLLTSEELAEKIDKLGIDQMFRWQKDAVCTDSDRKFFGRRNKEWRLMHGINGNSHRYTCRT